MRARLSRPLNSHGRPFLPFFTFFACLAPRPACPVLAVPFLGPYATDSIADIGVYTCHDTLGSGNAIEHASMELQQDRAIVIEAMLERDNSDVKKGHAMAHIALTNPLRTDETVYAEVERLRSEMEASRLRAEEEKRQASLERFGENLVAKEVDKFKGEQRKSAWQGAGLKTIFSTVSARAFSDMKKANLASVESGTLLETM